jgi:hypothetical protein
MNALAPEAYLERLQRRLAASGAREGRLRSWLGKLERRSTEAREARVDMSDVLVEKLTFVRGQLRKAERKSFDLRELIRKAPR